MPLGVHECNACFFAVRTIHYAFECVWSLLTLIETKCADRFWNENMLGTSKCQMWLAVVLNTHNTLQISKAGTDLLAIC